MPKTTITLSIDAPVKYAALRAFAGKARGHQLSAFVQRALIRHCNKIGEYIPPQFLEAVETRLQAKRELLRKGPKLKP